MDRANKIMDKKISIITATYNAELVFEDLVNSIIPQKTNDIEFIVIDGGSKDNTLNIIKKYNSNIDYWISEQDNGIYDAWNKGIRVSTGEWIMFLGADDILHQNTISDYIKVINKNPEVNYITSKIQFIDFNKTKLEIVGNAWSAKMKTYCSSVHVGSMHYKNLFVKKGYFDISYKSSGDYDFLLRCYDIIKPYFLPKITVDVRIGGISRKFSLQILKETLFVKLKNKSRPVLLCYYDFVIAEAKSFIQSFILGKK